MWMWKAKNHAGNEIKLSSHCPKHINLVSEWCHRIGLGDCSGSQGCTRNVGSSPVQHWPFAGGACVTAVPPDLLLSAHPKSLVLSPHSADGPCRPSALLRCYVSSCGRSWALQKAQKYGKLSWGQWSQVISGEMAPIWGQLHPFSPWVRDTACKGEDEPVKYGQEKRKRIAGVHQPWGRGSLQSVAHTRHCLMCWARPWGANVLPCLGTALHCTWQSRGGGVLGAAVRVDTATAWCQPTPPCFFQWHHQKSGS